MTDDSAMSVAKEITLAVISKKETEWWAGSAKDIGKQGGQIFTAALIEVVLGIDKANETRGNSS